MAESNTAETLPCGCVMATDVIDGQPVFLYEPCSLTCEYYLYALAETERQGKPITKIDLR